MQYFKQLYFSKENQHRAHLVHPSLHTARQAMSALDTCFRQCLETALNDNKEDKIGILLSGGVDSNLLLAMLSALTDKQIVCFTAMAESDDPDVMPSKHVAKAFKAKWVKCFIRKEDLKQQLKPLLKLSKGGLYDTAGILAVDTCLRHCKQEGISSLWTGNGLDMLFGGGVDPKRFDARSSQKFHEAFWQFAFDPLVNRFYEQTGDELNNLATTYGVKLIMPFETIDSILIARSIPASLLFKYDEDKYPVRLLAHKYEVPLQLARRKKAPLQNSSGTFDLLREYMYNTLPHIINDAVNFRLTEQYFKSNPNTDLQLFLALLAKQS
jgi:asparagine synthetase B (glutamine-hydrolysing)